MYATALNTAYDGVPRVITPATVYKDEPKTFIYDSQQYSPGNMGDKYSMQPVTLRDAMVKSLNVVTVDVADGVTIGRVMISRKSGLPRVPRLIRQWLWVRRSKRRCNSPRLHGIRRKREAHFADSHYRITNRRRNHGRAATAQKNEVLRLRLLTS